MPKQVQEVSIPTHQQNMFLFVETFDEQGRPIGERIVDMYHFGTNKWIAKHLYWAVHNKASVEMTPAKPEKIEQYLASAKMALAEKFNKAA